MVRIYTGFFQLMENLESHEIYYFIFQPWRVMEFKWRLWKVMEKQYAFGKLKGNKREKKKQALISVEIDTSTSLKHFLQWKIR